MNTGTKKKLIAWLLLAACVGSAWLFFAAPTLPPKRLHRLGQADSLLQLTLQDYKLDRFLRIKKTRVDSTFSRKTYTVSVPSAFPKTQFHAALKKKLSPYHISLPARVIFPDKDMHIYLCYRHTIIRTVQLKIRHE